jgi:beta-glucosidase
MPTIQGWKEVITTINNEANKTRLKIPVLYGIDAIHGSSYTLGATLFPQQIGMAATFNTELVKKELKYRHTKPEHPLFHGFFSRFRFI